MKIDCKESMDSNLIGLNRNLPSEKKGADFIFFANKTTLGLIYGEDSKCWMRKVFFPSRKPGNLLLQSYCGREETYAQGIRISIVSNKGAGSFCCVANWQNPLQIHLGLNL